MNNLNTICISIIALSMGATFVFIILFVADDLFSKSKWYLKLVYAGRERSYEKAEEFFGKTCVRLGIVNIVVPCLVVYGYLYYSNTALLDFLLNRIPQ